MSIRLKKIIASIAAFAVVATALGLAPVFREMSVNVLAEETDSSGNDGTTVSSDENEGGGGTTVSSDENEGGSGTTVSSDENEGGSGTTVSSDENEGGDGTTVSSDENEGGSGTTVSSEDGTTATEATTSTSETTTVAETTTTAAPEATSAAAPPVVSNNPVNSAAAAPETIVESPAQVISTKKPEITVNVAEAPVTSDIVKAFTENKNTKTLTLKYSSTLKIDVAKENISDASANFDFSVSGKNFITQDVLLKNETLNNASKIVQLDFVSTGKLEGVDKVTIKSRVGMDYVGKTVAIYEYVDGKLVKVGTATVNGAGIVKFNTDYLGQFVLAVE